MRKIFLFLFSLLIGIGLFWWIIKNIGWEEVKLVFKHFSPQAGFLILFLTILSVLIRSLRWKKILESQQCNVPFLKVFEYYLSGFSISFFFPIVIFGGEIFRGYDLKEIYSLPWSRSIASVIIDRILELTIYAIVTIFGIIFFILKATFTPIKLYLIIFLGTFLFIILISTLYFKILKRESIVLSLFKILNLKNINGTETIIDIEREIFQYFKPNKKVMGRGFFLSFLNELILLVRTLLLLLFLGKEITILPAVSIVAFSSLAMLIPIPAALGSHEAVQSFIFASLGLGANTGLAFVLVIRGVELVVALLGTVFLFKFGIQILESVIFEKIARLIRRRSQK